MTELAVVADTADGKVNAKVEIRQTEKTTDEEMAVLGMLSKEINLILQNAQRRSSLDSDWSKQYALTRIDTEEQTPEQGELF